MRQNMKQLEEQLNDKNEELNLYSQILGTPRSDPDFEMINSNLKIAPLTQQMAKLMIHMNPTGNDPATCLTPISTNEEPALITIDHYPLKNGCHRRSKRKP